MKLAVAIDSSGRIVGFAHAATHGASTDVDISGKKLSLTRAESVLANDDGQSTHMVELPIELERHFGKDGFADELFRHVAVKQGQSISLERAKE